MTENDPFDASDRQTVTWRKFMKYFEQRMDLLRRENDNTLSEVETAKVRGRIAECKQALALGEPAPKFKDSAGAKYS